MIMLQPVISDEKKKKSQFLSQKNVCSRNQGSISSTFYAKLLRAQIPKAQKHN
jgi:hypothetical protein